MKNFVEFQRDISELKDAFKSQSTYLKDISFKQVDDGFLYVGFLDIELGGPEPEGILQIGFVKDVEKFFVHFTPRLADVDDNNDPEFNDPESKYNILKGQECAKYAYNYLNK